MQIQPAKNGLSGIVTVPGDKSISHRCVMLGALSDGRTTVHGFLNGADCLATVNCFRKMGIEIEASGTDVAIYGRGLGGLEKPASVLYVGNSGTTARLLAGILAGQAFDATLDGDASIRRRPMGHIALPLRQMGARVQGEACPIRIGGRALKGITYALPVASAQLKSAILLAGLYASTPTTVIEQEKSRDHTERMLRYMGADVRTDGNTVTVYPAKQLHAAAFDVPADISSAAFFMVAAAIVAHSELTVKDVGINPTRTGILDVLKSMGADITLSNARLWGEEPVADITVRSSRMRGTMIGGELIPRLIDELPVLAVAAAFAEGTTVIRDAQQLKVKESDRLDAVASELSKAGVCVEVTADGMRIHGGSPVRGAVFDTYHDHRMAMSMAVLALAAQGESTVLDPAVVDISFPTFFELLERVRR